MQITTDVLPMHPRQPTPEMIAAYKAAAARIGNPNVSARGRLDASDFLSHSISADVGGFRANWPRPALRLVGVEECPKSK